MALDSCLRYVTLTYFVEKNRGDIPDVVLDHPNKASIDKISEAIHMFVFVFHWI